MDEQIIHERRIRQSKTLKGENDRLWNDNPHKKCYKDYFNMIKDLFFNKYKMKATIKTFPCIDGDCIFMKLYDQSNTDSFHIMIDCGALSENIIDFICHDLNLKIDLLIVTHIDKDHIDGITAMFYEDRLKKLEIGKILYNCYQVYEGKAQSLDETIRTQIEMIEKLASEDIGSQISVKGSVSLASKILEKQELKQVWERNVIKDTTPDFHLGKKWGKLVFLSPSEDAMKDLYNLFKEEYAGITSEKIPDKPFERIEEMYELLIRLDALRTRVFHGQRVKNRDFECGNFIGLDEAILESAYKTELNENELSKQNKASLAFVWECNGHRVLFLGDAQAHQVVTMLESKLGKGVLHFDAIKVSHHGSAYNATKELYNKIDSPMYYLTGGEEGSRPSLEAIAKIVYKGKTDKKRRVIRYNFKTTLTEELTSESTKDIRDKYNFKLENDNEEDSYEFKY